MSTDLELAERLNGVRLALLDRGVTSAHPDYIACEQAAARLRAYAEAKRVTLVKLSDGAWHRPIFTEKSHDLEYATFLREPTK